MACFTAVLAAPEFDSVDAIQRLKVARAVLGAGDVAIGYSPDPNHLTHLPGHDGRGYAMYGFGQTLLLIPLDGFATAVVALVPVSAEAKPLLQDSLVALLYRLLQAPLVVLLSVAVLRRLGLSSRSAVVWAGAGWLATPMLQWSLSMQEECLAGILLLAAVYLALSPRFAQRPCRYGLMFGACVGLLINTRYNGLLAAVVIAVFALGRLRRAALLARFTAAATASLAPWVALWMAYNWLRFRDVLQTGYQQRVSGAGDVWQWSTRDFFTLAAGPNYGLVWFAAPVLVVVVALHRRALWQRPAGGAVAATACTLVAAILFVSGFMIRGVDLYGGSRYLGHVLVLATPFAMLAWRALARRKLAPWVVLPVIGFGVCVQLMGTMFPPQLETMQRQVRSHAGMAEPSPGHVVAARAANIARWLRGDLMAASLPEQVDRDHLPAPISEPSFIVATTPSYLPWRARAGLRARQVAPQALVQLATGLWSAALLGGGLSMWMLRRRLGGSAMTLAGTPDRPGEGSNGR